MSISAITVPWNAAWSSEEQFEVRPCRWADGRSAMWMPHSPGVGMPVFAKPHFVRQRRSIVQMLCTVCGEPTPKNDRWWFALGEYRDEWFMTTEAPVHRVCADHALIKCPHLRRNNCAPDLTPFPSGHTVIAALVGGEQFEKDFGLNLNGRTVIGALKIAWPRDRIRVVVNREKVVA